MYGLIFAAGLGTRLKPWTDTHPKALVEVGGKPMLQRVIENMLHAGIDRIVINVHHLPDQIRDFVAANHSFGAHIIFSDESSRLLDTGGAVLHASRLIDPDEDILIHNVDIYTDLSLQVLIDRHNQLRPAATLLTSTRKSSRQLVVDSNSRLCGWINHNTGERLPADADFRAGDYTALSFNGIHIITPSVVRALGAIHSTGDVFPIIPQYVALSPTLDIRCFTPTSEYTWIDVGKLESLEMARRHSATSASS